MKEIQFSQRNRNKTFIDDLDMFLYRVHNNGDFESIKVLSVKDGLNRIPFIRPEIILLKFSVPKINGYEIRLIEKSKDITEVSLIYLNK